MNDLPFIDVVFSASDVSGAVRRGDIIVVIDILRCSSSIIVALGAGANAIIPVRTVREASEMIKNHPHFILAGERRGIPPPKFKYGNSPTEFLRTNLKRKHLIFTTTNGTIALSRVKDASHVLIGAFLNAKASAELAYDLSTQEDQGVTFLLSGKRGSFSLEDFLGAGAILTNFPKELSHSDSAQAALLAFQWAKLSILDIIKNGSHAKYLISLGFGEDVNLCSQLNQYSIVPYLKNERIIAFQKT